MDHSEEVSAVKKALDLEKACDKAYAELERISAERYASIPQAPIRRNVIKDAYPVINSQVKINWLAVLLPGIIPLVLFSLLCALGAGWFGFLLLAGGITWICIYIFKIWKPKRDQDIQNIMQGDWYKEQCLAVDTKYQNECIQSESEYQAAVEHYNNVVVVEYNSAKAEWEKNHAAQLSAKENQVNQLVQELDSHYAATQLIPEKYHKIVPLEHIYSVISTSQYTVKEAILDYEREEQRQIDIASVRAQQEANDLLDRQNEIAEKTRRDQNIANVVGAVQRHNIVKELKKK